MLDSNVVNPVAANHSPQRAGGSVGGHYAPSRGDVLTYLANHLVNRIPSHRVRMGFYRRLMKFNIGPATTILLGLSVYERGTLNIGAHTIVNERCRLDSRGGLTIGSNVSISTEVVILSGDHDAMNPGFGNRYRSVRIDDYVWIGNRAIILPGVHVGRGAIIAAGAVVTRNVAPLDVVAGVPARRIATRPESALNYTLDWHPPLL